jgi:uncharacterized membrane protein YqgA involved in biofilm formation
MNAYRGNSMILTGTIINGVSIIIGTIIGIFFQSIPVKVKETVLKVNGLFIIVMGIQMAISSKSSSLAIISLVSLVLGAVIGEYLDIDKKFYSAGNWIENKINRKESNVSKAFVTSSLMFVIGAMAILGALESGLRNNHTILFTKSLLDGITSIILASTLGFGVMLSAIPVVIYQGLIALMATQINTFLPQELQKEIISIITSTGGVLIIAIGTNLLELTKIRIANLLPSVLVSCLLAAIYFYI